MNHLLSAEDEMHSFAKIGLEEVNAWWDNLRDEAFDEMEAEHQKQQMEWRRLMECADADK